MFVLWCRWRYGGEDPYVGYNGPEATQPPPRPERVQAIRDAFAVYAHEVAMKKGAASL